MALKIGIGIVLAICTAGMINGWDSREEETPPVKRPGRLLYLGDHAPVGCFSAKLAKRDIYLADREWQGIIFSCKMCCESDLRDLVQELRDSADHVWFCGTDEKALKVMRDMGVPVLADQQMAEYVKHALTP